MHLGLIGGIGPAATEYYYRGLVNRCADAPIALQLTIAHADLRVAMANLAAKNRHEQAEIYNVHVRQLAAAGAGVAAVTSIAGHFCFDELAAISPLPLVSALQALKDELQTRGLNRVGLLGSSAAITTDVYGALADFDLVLPEGEELSKVNDEYFKMAVARRATNEQRGFFFEVGARLCREQKAEAIVLAGTDLFLAFEGHEPGFDAIDSATAHVKKLAELSQLDAT